MLCAAPLCALARVDVGTAGILSGSHLSEHASFLQSDINTFEKKQRERAQAAEKTQRDKKQRERAQAAEQHKRDLGKQHILDDQKAQAQHREQERRKKLAQLEADAQQRKQQIAQKLAQQAADAQQREQEIARKHGPRPQKRQDDHLVVIPQQQADHYSKTAGQIDTVPMDTGGIGKTVFLVVFSSS